jgi:pimeloyl-ACP methyl ester carboxylesterase
VNAVRGPRVVVTIHGIRTRGQWQKRITPHLASHGLVPYHIDFGWFRAFTFFFPWWRERQIRAIQAELRDLVTKVKVRRLSIIAHSFGTLAAVESLVRDNGALRYDRVVLTGSIIPRQFDWTDVLDKRWVIAVRNERATSDWVVRLALLASRPPLKWISRLNAGDSGSQPFEQTPPALLDDYLVGHHSETHNALKFERWARFIAYPLLPEDVLDRVTTEMQALRQHAASILDVPADRVRVNLFAPMDGYLRMVPGATDNMTHAPEFDIRILENHGATGTAFATGNPCIVLKRGDSWTGNTLPGDELDKINPALRWVISLPVRSKVRASVVGVINVDGLDTIPTALEVVDSPAFSAAVFALHLGILKRFEPVLEAAFRGDEPPTTIEG